jgi:hypothetical protein
LPGRSDVGHLACLPQPFPAKIVGGALNILAITLPQSGQVGFVSGSAIERSMMISLSSQR